MDPVNHVQVGLETNRVSGPAVDGRLLIVEPDELTLWSLTTYLGRWFMVESRRNSRSARGLLRAHSVEALVLSDQLPGRSSERLALLARRLNPRVRTVLMVAETARPAPAISAATRIEKPFALTELARLLGAPATSHTGT